MAAGIVTVIDRALEKLGDGTIDLDTNSFKVALCTKDQALGPTFAGTSGDARYSDLTDEVVGSGYVAGGAALTTVAWTRAGGIVSFTADPTSWTALTATMKYAVIYKNGGNGDILAIVDLETTDADGRVASNTDFIINWTSGLFTLARA
jgi:hypothetical protein